MTCKTSEGYIIKILTELLQSNLESSAMFEFDAKGIVIQQMDKNQSVIIFDIFMESKNFSVYRYNTDKPKLFVGVNLTHLNKMLKQIKKNDSLQFCLNSDNETDLIISIIPKEAMRHTVSSIKNQSLQKYAIDFPTGYGKSIIVSSREFQKMCKGLTHISDITSVTMTKNTIRFSNNAENVMARYVEFGETADFETSDDEDGNSPIFSEEFNTSRIVKISKISGLSNNLHFSACKGNPLLITSKIGSLGEISIYLNYNTQERKK